MRGESVCNDLETCQASLRAYDLRVREAAVSRIECHLTYGKERRLVVFRELQAMGVPRKMRVAIRKRMIVHDCNRIIRALIEMIGGR